MAKRKPRYILEIGTARGGTLFLFARIASSDALIMSIDLPGGKFGGGYPDWRVQLYKSFAIQNQKLNLIRENSHAYSTFKVVEKMLEGNKLDFLFIDGDHSYDGVKADFELYSKLVNEDGIIAFHDIFPGVLESVGGVPRFWNEIKSNFRHLELIKNREQAGCGIGIVYL